MDLTAAFLLGLFGSVHCIGMCGPLMLALPDSTGSRRRFMVGRVMYHVGKAVTYAVLGAVAGMAGKGLLITIQQDLSIVAGVTLLFAVLLPFSVRSVLSRYSPLRSFHRRVSSTFGQLLNRKGNTAMIGMGMLNGLLPCGLVYTALIGSAVSADALHSAVGMFLFGLGTIPSLIAVAVTGRLVSLRFRSVFSRTVPIVTAVVAVILILRGMNLGIPMISPSVSQPVQHETQVDCCGDR